MSKKYKDAMDKIVVSDELKERILSAAEQKISEKNLKSKSKHSRMFYIRYAAGCAACLVFCITAVFTVKQYMWTDITNPSGNSSLPTSAPTVQTNIPQIPQSSSDENIGRENNPPIENKEKNDANTAAESNENKQNSSDKKQESKHDTAEEVISTGLPQESIAIPETEPPKADGESSVPPVTAETEIPADIPALGGVNDGENTENDMVMSGIYTNDTGSIENIIKEVGYVFKIPTYMPEQYKFDEASLICGRLVQIVYANEENSVIYRTEHTDEDVSGDYNIYDDIERIKINENEVTIKGNDGKYHCAVWNDESAYSVYSSGGIDKDDMVKIIESVTSYSEN